MYTEKPRSNLWYLLPILFSIIGGGCSLFCNKKGRLDKSKNLLMCWFVDVFRIDWWNNFIFYFKKG